MCSVLMLLAVLSSPASFDDPSELVPAAWSLGPAERAPRTRGRHEHNWQTGPRGGEFYWTEWGTKVYRKRSSRR